LGKDPFAQYKNLAKKDWHDYGLMKSDRERKGPGEGGTPVAVPTDEKTKALQVRGIGTQ
jgi:hypothetical protein